MEQRGRAADAPGCAVAWQLHVRSGAAARPRFATKSARKRKPRTVPAGRPPAASMGTLSINISAGCAPARPPPPPASAPPALPGAAVRSAASWLESAAWKACRQCGRVPHVTG